VPFTPGFVAADQPTQIDTETLSPFTQIGDRIVIEFTLFRMLRPGIRATCPGREESQK
jgi:hypothetical protein